MIRIDLNQKELSQEQIKELTRIWKQSLCDILNCTTLAGCGHPGGSMSSIHFLLTLYAISNIHPKNLDHENRDRIIISHGHISPGVYSALGNYGFFDPQEMVLQFRKLGSRFAGHVETSVPGVEWNTGNLGQGISAAVGMALAGKTKGLSYKTIVCMGDGEQQKGQISEARRAAVKFGLKHLIGIIDYNGYQIGGAIEKVMPQNIKENYTSDGWNIIEIENGHDFQQIYQALKKAWNHEVQKPENPVLLLASTEMGHGVSFMTNGFDFHGRACSIEEHQKAFTELGLENQITELKEKRQVLPPFEKETEEPAPKINIDTGTPITYEKDIFTDNRSAYGAALADLGRLNNFTPENSKIAGISCDLEGSVKMNLFHKTDPKHFFECGICEHHAAVMAGSLSKEGYQVFFSTFGIFGVDEVYNQQRLNAFNKTNVKTVCTHLGLSVGEDGATHQAINYIGLLRNIPNYPIFIPADPNQTDHIIRYVAKEYGNFFVGMGRAKTPVITKEQGSPYFDKDYKFIPGKCDQLKDGTDVTIITLGPLLDYTIKAAKNLEKTQNIQVRILNMASVIPYDKEAVLKAAKETKAILTVEDHYVETGIGSIIQKILIEARTIVPVKHLGVKGFAASGSLDELYKSQGLSIEHIEEAVKNLIEEKKSIL